MKVSTLIKIWIAFWATLFMIGVIGLMITNAYAQDAFKDRWTNGTAPVVVTPPVAITLPPINIVPQITVTPQITVMPPIVTMGTPTIQTPAGTATVAPSGTPPVPAPLPVPKPKMLAPMPPPAPPPRIYAEPPARRYYSRRYYYDEQPMTDLSVPADRVNRGTAGCNGIACYP